MIAEGKEGVMEVDVVKVDVVMEVDVVTEVDAAMEAAHVVMEVAKGELVVVDVAARLILATLAPSHHFKWVVIISNQQLATILRLRRHKQSMFEFLVNCCLK